MLQKLLTSKTARLVRCRRQLEETRHSLEELSAQLDIARVQCQQDLQTSTQQISNDLAALLLQMRKVSLRVPSLSQNHFENDIKTLQGRIDGMYMHLWIGLVG